MEPDSGISVESTQKCDSELDNALEQVKPWKKKSVVKSRGPKRKLPIPAEENKLIGGDGLIVDDGGFIAPICDPEQEAGSSTKTPDMGATPRLTHPWVDVIRRGGRRRGYILIEPVSETELGIGCALCNTGEKFSGERGLGIAHKRAVRWSGKSDVVVMRQGDREHAGSPDRGNGGGKSSSTPGRAPDLVRIPHTIAKRLLDDVRRVVEKFKPDGEAHYRVPAWADSLSRSLRRTGDSTPR